MQDWDTMNAVRALLVNVAGERARDGQLETRPLRGGLESKVVLVKARFLDQIGRIRVVTFVLKQLEGRMVREAAIYERIASRFAGEMCPRVLGVVQVGQGRVYLCLEAIRRTHAWPWADVSISRKLLTGLAGFHNAAARSSDQCPIWDYDAEGGQAALETLDALERGRNTSLLATFARGIPPLRRMVLAHARLRRELLSAAPFSARPIHGDLHTGNAIVRRGPAGIEPVLLDWGRARAGSPLEDVSAWLHSSGFWVPEIRRRHDSLLADYLAALGMERKLTPSIRGAYGLAGCSNALSGALAHHIHVARSASPGSRKRTSAALAVAAWLRVIRRADACWN